MRLCALHLFTLAHTLATVPTARTSSLVVNPFNGSVQPLHRQHRAAQLTGDEAAWWVVDGVGGATATRATQEDIRQMTTSGTYGWNVTMVIYVHAHTA